MYIRACNKRLYIQKKKNPRNPKKRLNIQKKKSTGPRIYIHKKTREHNQVRFEYVLVFLVLSFASIYI